VNDYRLTPNEQCVNYIIARTSYIRCGDDDDDDDDVRFVLAQHLQLGINSSSSLNRHSDTFS